MSAATAPLRVAIAGCHRMLERAPMSHNWAAAFHAVPETEIAAVFDRGADTRKAFLDCWGEMPAYDDYARMLAEIQPDIVCIATRQTLHADQCELAAAAGVRGIFFEKPLATSMVEVDRMADACNGAGMKVVFGLDRRWWASYGHFRRLIADGLIGDVHSVIGYGLGQWINHGCHWYDVMLGLVGDPQPTWASGHLEDLSGVPADSRVHLDPPGRGVFGFGDNGIGYVMRDGGPAHGYEVLGSKGRLLILNDSNAAFLWDVREGMTMYDGAGFAARQIDFPREPRGWPAGPAIVRDLVEAIQTGGTTQCDMQRAGIVTELGFAFHASHQLGGARVTFPIENRSLRVESFPWGNE